MISLNEYFKNYTCNKEILIETYNIICNDIVNESFQSSLLLKLATKIKEVEKKHRQDDQEHAKRWKEQGYSGTPTKTERSFASIFGPLIEQERWGDPKTGIQGLKWSEIKDSDFKQYKGYDKEFAKVLKSLYSKKIKADIIACKEDTQDILYFVKGYAKKEGDIRVYYFVGGENWGSGVHEKTEKKYQYHERPLKVNETLELLNDCDVYVLEITDSMLQNYNQLHNDRKDSQKGVINCDEESLKKLLKQQQARYNKMIDQVKKMKLQANPEGVFDEIKQINQEVVDLFSKVINNPANLDQRFDLDDLMRYVSYAYEQFYKSMRENRDADKSKYSGEYYREQAKNYLKDAKEYVDKVRKKIDEIKSKIV